MTQVALTDCVIARTSVIVVLGLHVLDADIHIVRCIIVGRKLCSWVARWILGNRESISEGNTRLQSRRLRYTNCHAVSVPLQYSVFTLAYQAAHRLDDR